MQNIEPNSMPLQIRFHGAANTVTGSCFALVTERAHVLIDCGMFQGSKTEKEPIDRLSSSLAFQL